MKPSEWRWLKFSTGRIRKCHYCRCELNFFTATVDHYYPRFRGGSNDPLNFRLACAPCNNAKGSMHPRDFKKRA
jgi:5-methylcytosine-specific restriction endonuclease McrA